MPTRQAESPGQSKGSLWTTPRRKSSDPKGKITSRNDLGHCRGSGSSIGASGLVLSDLVAYTEKPRRSRGGTMSLVCPIAKCKEQSGPCNCEKIIGAIIVAAAFFAVYHHVITTP